MNNDNVNVVEDEMTIDLGAMLYAVWKKAWIIAIAAVIGAGAAFGFTKLMIVPRYTSNAMLYVLTKTTSISSNFNLALNQQLTIDFVILAETRPVIESVINDMNLDATYEQLVQTVSVENISDSSVLKITATNPDPQLAASIANTLADKIAEQIATVMVTDRPSTMEKAVPSTAPSSPNTTRNMAMGGLLGAFSVLGVVVLMFILDDTVKNPEDVKKWLDVPVLAAFPLEKDGKA